MIYKLLFLSGGNLVGQNVLFALSMRREYFNLVVLNSKVDEPSVFDFDTAYHVPSLVENRSEFEKRFAEIVLIENPDLIIPCRDEDVAYISELAKQKPELQPKLLCGSHSVALALLSKDLSWEFSKAYGLPYAPIIHTNADPHLIEAFIVENGLPVIAKPIKGFASQGVQLIYNEHQLKSLTGHSNYILQKYLGDPKKIVQYIQQITNYGIPLFHSFEETKISVQGSIGPNGEIGGVFITEHKMCQGKSDTVDFYNDTHALNQGKYWVNIFAKAGWRGPINIQCQYDQDKNLVIYEFNGRFTGGTSGRILLGYDEVRIILELWLGVKLPPAEIEKGNKSVKRIPLSKVVALKKVEEFRKNGIWNNRV